MHTWGAMRNWVYVWVNGTAAVSSPSVHILGGGHLMRNWVCAWVNGMAAVSSPGVHTLGVGGGHVMRNWVCVWVNVTAAVSSQTTDPLAGLHAQHRPRRLWALFLRDSLNLLVVALSSLDSLCNLLLEVQGQQMQIA